MRVVILNLHKFRHFIRGVKFISVMMLLLIFFHVVSGAYFNSDRFVEVLQKENEKNLVIIDAGHGGEDPGAIGPGEVYEKNLNLEIGMTLGALLEERGFAVMYTRTEDKLLYSEAENIKGIRKISDLKNRCKIAAEYPDAIFVSIHMNSFGNSKYSGLQVYYSENNENSRILATKIQSSVRDSLQNDNDRVIKQGKNMYVMENITNPAVLIECGFLTNYEECKKLCEKEYQNRLSLAIVCGIIEYKEQISSY